MDDSGTKLDERRKARVTGLSYENAGVSISAAEETVRRIKLIAERTRTAHVLEGIGPFGASFRGRFEDLEEPILVSTTDGVGTKVKLSARFKSFRTIGYDLVAVNANDIITTSAFPLFFLDYIACHRVDPDAIEQIAEGMADACLECGCSLIGGEISEMRDLYAEGEFDLAGFMVGVVDKNKRVTGENITCGDVILGLPSSGVHANGLTLARKAFESLTDEEWRSFNPDLGKSLAEELLTPTKVYVHQLSALKKTEVEIKGIVHVSGGGIRGNLGRILPAGVDAVVYRDKIETPPIFKLIAEAGGVSDGEMWRVFNMGMGMLFVLDPEQAEGAKACAEENDFPLIEVGEIVEGNASANII